MPHFIAECTCNIKDEAKLDELFAKVNQALGSTGVFPLGGIRSRAIFLDTYQMADGAHDYAFVHMTLKIGAGRDMETKKQTGQMLFDIITEHFAPLQEKRLLALSFVMEELDPVLNFKKNNVHAFLKQQK